MDRYRYCVIGAGIVGLSTAHHLLTAQPGASVVVLDGAGYALAVASIPARDGSLAAVLEDIFVVVVDGLHHLVATPERASEADHRRRALIAVECRLKINVKCPRT